MASPGNSLPKTVTRQRRGCDLNPGPSAPESSTLTTRLSSHPPYVELLIYQRSEQQRREQTDVITWRLYITQTIVYAAVYCDLPEYRLARSPSVSCCNCMRYETLMQRLCPADMYDFNRGGVARSLCNTVLYKELRTSPTPRLLPSETPPPLTPHLTACRS